MSNIEVIKNILNKHTKYINIAFLMSAIGCSTLLSLNYSVFIKYNGYTGDLFYVKPLYAFIAVCVMIPVYLIMIYRQSFIKKTIKNLSVDLICIDAFFTTAIVIKLISDTIKNYPHIKESSLGKILKVEAIDNFSKQWISLSCILCGIAVFFVLAYLIDVIKAIIKEILPLTVLEKNYCLATLLFSIFAIFFVYQRANGQWMGLDLVYQNDSIFLYEHYYPVFSYGYDFDWDIGNGGIRHPLATLITFPIYVVVYILSTVLFFIPSITAILYALSNAFMLVLTTILLVRVTDNKWLFPIFSLCNPFLFYVIFLEKYQISVFLSVLFLYLVKKKANKAMQGTALIASGGIMITSAFCGFAYGEETAFKKRIKEYILIFVAFILVLIGTGRISYLLNFMYLKNQNYMMFFKGSQMEKLCSYSNMIVSCFVPVPYNATDKNLSWSNYNTNFNYLCIVIFVLVLVAFFKHHKRVEVKVFILWILWSFLQFVFGSNSPLFNLYYAWAFIPMTLLGIETLVKNRRIIQIINTIIIVMFLYCNINHMIDVCNYLILKTPV